MRLALIVAVAVGTLGAMTWAVLSVPMDGYPSDYHPGACGS